MRAVITEIHSIIITIKSNASSAISVELPGSHIQGHSYQILKPVTTDNVQIWQGRPSQ